MATINMEQAKELDLILETLLKAKNRVFSVGRLQEELLPHRPIEYILYLYQVLAEYYPRLMYPKDNLNADGFWARDYASAFLHNGGFTAMYEAEEKKQEREAEKERLNTEKLRYDIKNAKRIYKTYWWTFGLSVAAFLMALGKILYDLYKDGKL